MNISLISTSWNAAEEVLRSRQVYRPHEKWKEEIFYSHTFEDAKSVIGEVHVL